MDCLFDTKVYFRLGSPTMLPSKNFNVHSFMPLHHISTQDSIRRLEERTEIRNSRKEVRWKIGENNARLHPLSSSAKSDVRHCHPCELNIVKTLGIRCQTERDRADYFRKDMYQLNLKLEHLTCSCFQFFLEQNPKGKIFEALTALLSL